VDGPTPADAAPAPGRLAGALLVLLSEVAILTFWVEFPAGTALGVVASGRVCGALLFALAAFLLLSGREGCPGVAPGSAGGGAHAAFWLAANLLLYSIFFSFTVRLAGGRASPWALSLWLPLAAAVAGTSFLAFFPLRVLACWGWRCRARALAALSLAVGLALAAPRIQTLWPRLSGPALQIGRGLLEWTSGEAVAGWTAGGGPVLGPRRLLLLVTPQCSELDAIAAFWLLGGVFLVARCAELRPTRVAFVLLLGTGLFYLLLAVRLCGLVVAGQRYSPQVSVSLAHSRISSIVFLGLAVALLSGTYRWCRRPARPGGIPSLTG
jgi:exosortase/archaeosortase family protein